MKRQVDYLRVEITFIVTLKEAHRATDKRGAAMVADLKKKLISAITDNQTNALDAEEIVVLIED